MGEKKHGYTYYVSLCAHNVLLDGASGKSSSDMGTSYANFSLNICMPDTAVHTHHNYSRSRLLQCLQVCFTQATSKVNTIHFSMYKTTNNIALWLFQSAFPILVNIFSQIAKITDPQAVSL